MINIKAMKVEEIRKLLIEKYNWDETKVAQLKGKTELANALTQELSEDILETAEEVVEEHTVVDSQSIPTPSDKEWTEYVLSQMYEDEFKQGHPTVDGLRRVTELLLGTINAVVPTVHQCPSPENQYHSTVSVMVHLDTGISMGGTADVGINNTEQMYARHASATAESKAEARAYRRILRLRNIIAAEELSDEQAIEESYEKIKDSHYLMINTTCQKLDIDVQKWLAKKEIDVAKLDKISSTKATQLCEELNGMRSTGAVSDDIKGYNPNWRN